MAESAPRDQNRVPTLIGVSTSDLKTPELVAVDPVTNRMLVNAAAALSNLEYDEDTVHTTGDKGIMTFAVRNDVGTALAGDGDYIPFTTDANGHVRATISGAALISERTSNTDGAPTAFTNFGATPNYYNYVTGYHVFRTDAGLTPIYVDFRDGTTGAILWTATLPPNGGSNNPAYIGPGLFRTSTNTALAYDISAATTTVYISVTGYKSKV